MNVRVEKYGEKVGVEIVEKLSKKYGFSKSDAIEYLRLNNRVDKKVKENKKSIPVPFCGVKCEESCEGIRLNHGLYTQCTNEKVKSIDGHMVCSTCEKQIEKNSNRMPTYGYIEDRIRKGKDFRDPKGKAPLNYGNIMEKLNITREEAEREAAKQGLTIPEDEFEIKKARRGRPKKDTTAVDTSGSEDDGPKAEKKRGRPKKEKEVVSSSSDSMIKELIDSANKKESAEPAPKTETKKEAVAEEAEDSDDEQTEVEMFTFNGKKYLKSTSDNTLYDVDTWDEIGVWNEETNSIDDVESDED